MSSDFVFDTRDRATQGFGRRRFGTGTPTVEDRQREVQTLRIELRRLQQSNDYLSSQSADRSLNRLITDIGWTSMNFSCKTIQTNLARMSEIFVRMEQLRQLGYV